MTLLTENGAQFAEVTIRDVGDHQGPWPREGEWFSLLVMIDIFSRYVVGWALVRSANAEIARTFIAAVLRREGIAPGQAAVHADRGTEMASKPAGCAC